VQQQQQQQQQHTYTLSIDFSLTPHAMTTTTTANPAGIGIMLIENNIQFSHTTLTCLSNKHEVNCRSAKSQAFVPKIEHKRAQGESNN
jgi:hypothetical protein